MKLLLLLFLAALAVAECVPIKELRSELEQRGVLVDHYVQLNGFLVCLDRGLNQVAMVSPDGSEVCVCPAL
jgi:DNA phosphorothioation-dependent restriction protein DptG